MKTRRVGYLLFLIAISVLYSSCNLGEETLNWKPSVIAPIIYTEVNVKDVSDLQDKRMKFEIDPSDLGFVSGVPVYVPPTYIERIGPKQIDLSDYFIDVDIDSATFKLIINNTFPIPIDSGTKIILRSMNDTLASSIIYQYRIEEDIPPESEFVVLTNLRDQNIPATVYLEIKDYRSSGGTLVTFSDDPTEFILDITFLTIKTVRIKTNNALQINDTLGLEFENSGSDSAIQDGTLSIKFRNDLPANVKFQLYFLDGLFNKTDSLFTDRISIPAGSTNSLGVSLTVGEEVAEVIVDAKRVERWENSAHVGVKFNANTFGFPGTSVTASNDLNIRMHIGGDLDLKISLNE
ncbi:MAG: hypothetical protein HKN92_03235 [Chitinophagales bacterium]|nr:hypothetical protein [Chitinophagales bacterium]